MKKIIPYGKHYIDNNDIRAVVANLKSGSLTQGPKILQFENAIKKYVNCKYAVAVSSCTAGMHISLLAVGFKKDNLLLTSPLSFVSTANVGILCNGKVDFADIESSSLNFSISEIKKKNNKYKAIIPVHFAGKAFNIKKLRKSISKKTFIIEDAAHAFGSKHEDGSMVGSCKHSDATVFSFHPVKTLACGEGGIVTTNNKELYKKLLRLRSHGINKLDDNFKQKKQAFTKKIKNPWYYEMQELGFNYRMTELQASLGLSQLKKIDLFLTKRKKISKYYYNYILKHKKNINFEVAQEVNYNNSSNHLFIIKINLQKIKKSRAEIMGELLKKNIQTQVHYIPIPMHPFYKKYHYNKSDYKNANKYYSSCLSIPIFYELNKKMQDTVIKRLVEIIK